MIHKNFFKEKKIGLYLAENYFNMQSLYNLDEGETKFYNTYVPL